MDSGVESDRIAAFCGTDNYAAGVLAAEKLCEAIGEEGQIAVALHTQSSQTAVDRLRGIEETLAEYPEVQAQAEIVQDPEMEFEDALAAALEQSPGIRGIVCTSGPMAIGMIEALHALGREDISVVGFDSGKEQLEAVREGTEYGLVSQDPRAIGYVSVMAALYAAGGEQVDRQIRTGFVWIDQKNVDMPETGRYLYE